MANFQPGTRVRDIATGWAGTVQTIPTNGMGRSMNDLQLVPPGFPANYNDGLILVQWDNPGGGKLPGSVFVANSPVVVL